MASAPLFGWVCGDQTSQLEHIDVGVVGQEVGVDSLSDPAIGTSMRTLLLLITFCLMSPALELPTREPPKDRFADPVNRMMYFAVLEGCYRDGLNNKTVDLILPKDPKDGRLMTEYNFVYSCPLCMPTIEALSSYRARVPFYDKLGSDTFGKGLPEEVLAALANPERRTRLAEVQKLVNGWVQTYLADRRLTDAERAAWAVALEDRRKRGAEALKQLRNAEHGDFYTKIYADWPKTCAVCDGAAKGGGVVMPAPDVP